MTNMLTRTVLFYRDFRGFSGGHLKVWNYFIHVRHAKNYTSKIYFSQETVWDESNPWVEFKDSVQPVWDIEKSHILFLAGLDWLMLSEEQRDAPKRPVINLIQHVRHSYRTDERYAFLHHKAIRICVSKEVKTALEETKRCNGPLITIPNGIDTDSLPSPLGEHDKAYDILIAGLKQPELTNKLREALESTGKIIKSLTRNLLRDDYLNEINNAKITIFLPHEQEGFYLPALEGMALGTLVICPDCVGNRSFCLHKQNCFRPQYRFEDLINSVYGAFSIAPENKHAMLTNARRTVSGHDLMKERNTFLKLLNDIDELW
jgi:hypothetical protein